VTPSEIRAVIEHRADRAAFAAADAKRNTPAGLLVLAFALLAVALLAVFISWGARSRAVDEVDARIAQATLITDKASKIKGINERLKSVADSRANDPLPGIPLKLQQSCPSERLQAVLTSNPARESAGGVDAGNVPKRFQYNNLQHDSMADFMAWIEAARRDIPGLEIDRMSFKPQANQWSFSITFIRWERKES
jgi:hypothetical protein